MSSKTVEDAHVSQLAELLSASGTLEEQTVISEEHVLEEQVPHIVEEIQEELPEIFPTPSLRRVLPDRIRKIEEQNRIHVLPEEFKTDIDPNAIPKIAKTAPQRYIDILADIVGSTQAVLILWFCEWMKEMQHFDAADRQRMLRRFQYIPSPAQAGVHYKATEETPGLNPKSTAFSAATSESKHLVTFKGAAYECCLRDLTKIIHYIFDLLVFSTDYQYNLVRSVFTFPPEYVLIDAPYQIQNPKRLYMPLKIKPKKEKSPKKDPKATKGKKKELMQKDERKQEERELHDMEDWNRRSHILPLSAATTDEMFDKYWPPPPPEPEPEPEPEPKGKKGKK
ncbi:unnamed protein product [Diatraea saccharalis]|uniref:Uncharacterized protein n=1 Tax=Diatraea saccharalis TaxID=40085 RepID=A0A9N9RC58_9NEOP|nr:unnamed protein product [Diatraea saccharalis]